VTSAATELLQHLQARDTEVEAVTRLWTLSNFKNWPSPPAIYFYDMLDSFGLDVLVRAIKKTARRNSRGELCREHVHNYLLLSCRRYKTNASIYEEIQSEQSFTRQSTGSRSDDARCEEVERSAKDRAQS
jgi:hypothetical protein